MPTTPPLVTKTVLAAQLAAIKQVPASGTTGQVLVMGASGYQWSTPPAPSASQVAAAGAATSVVVNGQTVTPVNGQVNLGTLGTSNLTLGSTATTAKPGNYAPTAAEVKAAGAATSVKVNGTVYQATSGVIDLGTIASTGTVVATPTAAQARRTAIRQAQAAQPDVAVPSYFWPDDSYTTGPQRWRQMNASAPPVGLAVANPNSGPGTAVDANFTRAVQEAHAAGIAVLGYVRTNYGQFTLATVEAQIDQYLAWYPDIDGVFLDEAGDGSNRVIANDVTYYTALRDYIHGKDATLIACINPGTDVTQAMLDTADIIATHELPASTYLTTAVAQRDYYRTVPAGRFWHIVTDVADAAQAAQVLAKAASLGVGHVYITDDKGPTATDSTLNPYDVLPSDAIWNVLTRKTSTAASSSSGGTVTGTGTDANGYTTLTVADSTTVGTDAAGYTTLTV